VIKIDIKFILSDTMSQTNFSKYFVKDDIEDFLGINVTDIGYSHVPPHTVYPDSNHPAGYYFNWENGRILDEYQLLYITRGQGTLELKKGVILEVNAGTFFVLYPNTWHRYKPLKGTGWDEYWVGFHSNSAFPILYSGLIKPGAPIHYIGIKNNLVNLFEELIEIAKHQSSGFSASLAGGVFYLTGQLFNALKNLDFTISKSENQMQQALNLLYKNVDTNISMEAIASQTGMGYSSFRRTFISYTGISPNQYFLKLKLSKAMQLLRYSDLPVKEIASLLGFETVQYFTRFIKGKTGKNPGSFKTDGRVG
jgi:AraC-like DNA-binding protein